MRIVLKPVGAVVLIAAIGLLTFLAWRSTLSKEQATTNAPTASPLASGTSVPSTAPPLIVYKDSLENGWLGQGGAKKIDYSNSTPVNGSTGRSVRIAAGPGEGVKIHHPAVDIANYRYLLFFVQGGEKAGQSLSVGGSAGGNSMTRVPLPRLQPNKWMPIAIPLAKLGVQGRHDLEAISIRNDSGKAVPAFFVDDIQFSATETPVAPPEIVSPWAKPQPE